VTSLFNPAVTLPLEIYPMPVNDMLHIKGEEREYDYSIIDFTGKMILHHSTNDNSISVSTLPEGIYLLKVEHRSQVYLARFVVMR
jgi:hypothetical protein